MIVSLVVLALVTLQRLAATGLQVQLLAVDERQRAEAVVLRLKCPAVPGGELGFAPGELGFDRWLQW